MTDFILISSHTQEPATKHRFHETDQGSILIGVGVRVKQIGPVAAKVPLVIFYSINLVYFLE